MKAPKPEAPSPSYWSLLYATNDVNGDMALLTPREEAAREEWEDRPGDDDDGPPYGKLEIALAAWCDAAFLACGLPAPPPSPYREGEREGSFTARWYAVSRALYGGFDCATGEGGEWHVSFAATPALHRRTVKPGNGPGPITPALPFAEWVHENLASTETIDGGAEWVKTGPGLTFRYRGTFAQDWTEGGGPYVPSPPAQAMGVLLSACGGDKPLQRAILAGLTVQSFEPLNDTARQAYAYLLHAAANDYPEAPEGSQCTACGGEFPAPVVGPCPACGNDTACPTLYVRRGGAFVEATHADIAKGVYRAANGEAPPQGYGEA